VVDEAMSGMRGRLALTLIGPGFAAIFALAIGTGYFMGQTAFRPSLPPPGPRMPTTASPGLSTPESQSQQVSPEPLSLGEPPSGPLTQETPVPNPSATPPEPPAADLAPTPAGPEIQIAPVKGGGPTTTPEIPSPPSRFHVEVGSFDDRGAADTRVTELRARGYAVTLVEGPPYRVWVGGYLDRSTAERLAANLTAAGFEVTLSPR
jgi:cell division protein FtsN